MKPALHATLEPEMFYPALRAARDAGDRELLDEAAIEHAGVRELVDQLAIMAPRGARYDATVIVPGEEVAHHIDKEERELFDVPAPAAARQGAARWHEGVRRQPRAPN